MATTETLIANFKNWFDEFEKKNLPQYQDLPDIPLYMEQLIYYLKSESKILETSSYDTQISSSMINNYVKAKIVDKPEKKKYSKAQISELLEIIYLKEVLSLPEIKQIFDITYTKDKEKAYKDYAETKKQATKKAIQDAKIQLNDVDYSNEEDIINAALDLAAKANAYAVISKRLLHLANLIEYSETKDEVIAKALEEHSVYSNSEENSSNSTDLDDDL